MASEIKIPKDLIQELCDLKAGASTEIDGKTYELVEIGDWDDEGKYQYQEVIFKLNDKFYSASISRNGSYFSDYNYDYPDEAFQVQQVEKTVKVWESVKEASDEKGSEANADNN